MMNISPKGIQMIGQEEQAEIQEHLDDVARKKCLGTLDRSLDGTTKESNNEREYNLVRNNSLILHLFS